MIHRVLPVALIALAAAAVSFGDTGHPASSDVNILLDDPESARDTAAVAFERITGEAPVDVGDPEVNRHLRSLQLPDDPGSLPAP